MLYKLAAKCRGEKSEDDSEEFAHGVDSTEAGAGTERADDGFRPAKLFSIDRVFRNETMDATHLAEFHQVEGVVADRNLTLADLIGTCSYIIKGPVYANQFVLGFMRVFFQKMGIEKVRFKPAYNPYTEVNCFQFYFNSWLIAVYQAFPRNLCIPSHA